jgi:hypothetical protein
MEPVPLPSPELEETRNAPHVITELRRPSLLLLHPDGNFRVLLSRDTQITRNRIRLVSARLITIPEGWRLRCLQLFGCFSAVRLPDEIEFDLVHLPTDADPSPLLTNDATIGYATCPDDLIHLTAAEYRALQDMPGRQLRPWIQARQRAALTAYRPPEHWDRAA